MVYVEKDLCVACGKCARYCPLQAITVDEVAFIDPRICVECSSCIRAGCPVDALRQPDLKPPRLLRKLFSDPLAKFEQTDVPGRGTEEMKTNDVTDNFKHGEVGWGVEMGRPGVSTSFEDVEKVSRAISRHDVQFTDLNPISMCIDDSTGEFKADNPWGVSPETLRNVRALSAIIEFKAGIKKTSEIIDTLRKVAGEIDTVFSVGVITRWKEGEMEVAPYLERSGIAPRPNGKHNMGLGRAIHRLEVGG